MFFDWELFILKAALSTAKLIISSTPCHVIPYVKQGHVVKVGALRKFLVYRLQLRVLREHFFTNWSLIIMVNNTTWCECTYTWFTVERADH